MSPAFQWYTLGSCCYDTVKTRDVTIELPLIFFGREIAQNCNEGTYTFYVITQCSSQLIKCYNPFSYSRGSKVSKQILVRLSVGGARGAYLAHGLYVSAQCWPNEDMLAGKVPLTNSTRYLDFCYNAYQWETYHWRYPPNTPYKLSTDELIVVCPVAILA